MARVLASMFEEAKRTGTLDTTVKFLYDTVNATNAGLADVPVACHRGCSHCCHTWVSAFPPEILATAKLLRARGEAVMAMVRVAHDQTKAYDFETRDQHPTPCPLLDQDLCSIYDARPVNCRLAASADAGICARTYHNLTQENVPTPLMNIVARSAYGFALVAGLRKAGLPYETYEWNAGLNRALETTEAEQRWLAGENIFAGILQEHAPVLNDPRMEELYARAFANP